jgi:hypothetical protein
LRLCPAAERRRRTAGETARAEETAARTGSKKACAVTLNDRECKNLVLEDGGQGALTEPGNPSGVACDPDTPLRHGRSEQSVERLIPERRNREVEMRRLKDVERRKSPPNLSPKRFRGNPE